MVTRRPNENGEYSSESGISPSGGHRHRQRVGAVSPPMPPKDGELSETELEKQRALLLAQLKEPESE